MGRGLPFQPSTPCVRMGLKQRRGCDRKCSVLLADADDSNPDDWPLPPDLMDEHRGELENPSQEEEVAVRVRPLWTPAARRAQARRSAVALRRWTHRKMMRFARVGCSFPSRCSRSRAPRRSSRVRRPRRTSSSRASDGPAGPGQATTSARLSCAAPVRPLTDCLGERSCAQVGVYVAARPGREGRGSPARCRLLLVRAGLEFERGRCPFL